MIRKLTQISADSDAISGHDIFMKQLNKRSLDRVQGRYLSNIAGPPVRCHETTGGVVTRIMGFEHVNCFIKCFPKMGVASDWETLGLAIPDPWILELGRSHKLHPGYHRGNIASLLGLIERQIMPDRGCFCPPTVMGDQ